MELRVLKYFLVVAQEENITRASHLLHVTQPTLSRQLMQLEQELGVKLFERSNHRIILTSEGLLLKRRAYEIVSLAEKTKKEISGGQTLAGEIEIGSGEFMSFSFFSDVVSRFSKQNPDVHFKLHSGNADTIKERLENGVLDLGILADPVDISRYEFVRLPQKEKWGVIAHKDLDICQKDSISPSDLAKLPIIIPHRKLVQDEIKNWFGEYYDESRIYAVYDLLYNAAIMAGKKMGVILSIELESKFENLRFIPLNPSLEFGSVLVWKKNKIHSVVTEAFIEYFKKCVKGISDNAI